MQTLLINVAAFTLLGLVYIWLSYRLQREEQALEAAHAQAALRGAA
jgi:hypothetical protein